MNDCVFDCGEECSALTERNCEGCRFYKTQEQFEQDQHSARVKNYLGQVIHIDKSIESKRKLIVELKEQAASIGVSLSEKVGGTKENHKENCLIRAMDLEREIAEDIQKLMETKAEIYEVIQSVKDIQQRTILELRYLRRMEWQEISLTMGYTYGSMNIFKVFSKAIESVKLGSK